MLDVPRQMVRANLTTSYVTLATVPVGTTWIIKNIALWVNTTNVIVNLQLNGFTLMSSNLSTGLYTYSISQVLTAGQTIIAQANAAGPVLHIAGIEVAL